MKSRTPIQRIDFNAPPDPLLGLIRDSNAAPAERPLPAEEPATAANEAPARRIRFEARAEPATKRPRAPAMAGKPRPQPEAESLVTMTFRVSRADVELLDAERLRRRREYGRTRGVADYSAIVRDLIRRNLS